MPSRWVHPVLLQLQLSWYFSLWIIYSLKNLLSVIPKVFTNSNKIYQTASTAKYFFFSRRREPVINSFSWWIALVLSNIEHPDFSCLPKICLKHWFDKSYSLSLKILDTNWNRYSEREWRKATSNAFQPSGLDSLLGKQETKFQILPWFESEQGFEAADYSLRGL